MSTGPLLTLDLDPRRPPGRELEEQLRALIRRGTLPVGADLPSTRALAADLGVSRGVAVRAYAQLAAEGYIALRRGAVPVVVAAPREPPPWDELEEDVAVALARYNLRPDLPDLALFPRNEWLAATRAALARAANHDLAYGEPWGAAALRHQLAAFLSRTRGVVATPYRTGVFAGSSHALHTICTVLRTHVGARRIGIEDPGHRWRTRAVAASGLEVVPVPVDADGLCVDALDGIDAVVVSPDHHFPTGAALSPERRRALAAWATGGRLVIEHDYDAHFRYDRTAAGTLQALAPDNIAYVGSASALLAPTLRIGWAVIPPRLVVPTANHLFATTLALPRIAQHTLAEFIARGYLDRHLRRARFAYGRRRELLVRQLPEAAGALAGLFVSLPLPEGADESLVLAAARSRGIALDGFGEHTLTTSRSGLVIGFAAAPEPTLRRALIQLLAARTKPGKGRERGPHDYGP